MSAVEEKSSNNEDENESIAPKVSEDGLEGNIKKSDENADTVSGISKKMSLSATNIAAEDITKAGGDSNADILAENIEKSEITEENSKTDSGVGSGDCTTKIDTTSKSDKSVQDDEAATALDDLDDDDDLELKWDDDDDENAETDNKDKPTEAQAVEDTKNLAKIPEIIENEIPKVLKTSEDSLGDVTIGQDTEDLDVSAEEERLLLEESTEDVTEKSVDGISQEITALIENIEKQTLEFTSKVLDKSMPSKEPQTDDKITVPDNGNSKETITKIDVTDIGNSGTDRIKIDQDESIRQSVNISEDLANIDADKTDNQKTEISAQVTEPMKIVDPKIIETKAIDEENLVKESVSMAEDAKTDESMDITEKEIEKKARKSIPSEENSGNEMCVEIDLSEDDKGTEKIANNNEKAKNLETPVESDKIKAEIKEEIEKLSQNIDTDLDTLLIQGKRTLTQDADVSIDIKTDHKVKKPDVMIEIPTQELIDLDDMDLSMNPDETDVGSPEKEHSMERDEIIVEKCPESPQKHHVSEDVDNSKDQNVDQDVVMVEKTSEEVQAPEKLEEREMIGDKGDVVCVEKESRPETIEETMEKMFADDDEEMGGPESEAPTSQELDVQPSTSRPADSSIITKPEKCPPIPLTHQKMDIPTTDPEELSNISNIEQDTTSCIKEPCIPSSEPDQLTKQLVTQSIELDKPVTAEKPATESSTKKPDVILPTKDLEQSDVEMTVEKSDDPAALQELNTTDIKEKSPMSTTEKINIGSTSTVEESAKLAESVLAIENTTLSTTMEEKTAIEPTVEKPIISTSSEPDQPSTLTIDPVVPPSSAKPDESATLSNTEPTAPSTSQAAKASTQQAVPPKSIIPAESATPSTYEPATPSTSIPAESAIPSTDPATSSTVESATPSIPAQPAVLSTSAQPESAIPSTDPATPSISTPAISSTIEPVAPSTESATSSTVDPPTLSNSAQPAIPSTSTQLATSPTIEQAAPSADPATPSTDPATPSISAQPAILPTSQPADPSTPVQSATSSTIEPAVPSTSEALQAMTPDTSDEVPEVSDSLGLLAESSARIIDDDDDDNYQDDDDFDQDESSNQISAEQSEDSNPVTSDTEAGVQKDVETPGDKQFAFNFSADGNEKSKDGNMDIDEENPEIQSEVSMDVEENTTTSAFDELLKDKDGTTVPKESEKQSQVEKVKLSEKLPEDKAQKKEDVKQVTEETKKDEEEKPPRTEKSPEKQAQVSPKQSPSKLQKLSVSSIQNNQVYNIVELQESSSEDDIQELNQSAPETTKDKPPLPELSNVIKVNIPSGIEVMTCGSGSTSQLTTKQGELVVSVPKPPSSKSTRLNTSEISIKTASNTEPLVIPEAKVTDKQSLETFTLDSDEEDSANKENAESSPHKMTAVELEKARETSKCINYSCTSGSKEVYKVADAATVAYYDAGRKRRAMVCQSCANVVAERTKNLILGIKDMTPLLELEMSKRSEDLVEISDSDSEEEDISPDEPKETIGEKGAKFLEDNLSKLLNEAWIKYDLDTRLKDTQYYINEEIEKLETESQVINKMLDDCQQATDKLRCDLYATFECRREELPAITIYDVFGQKQATDKLRCDLYATFQYRREELLAITIYDVFGQKFHVEPELKIPPISPDSMESRLAKRLLQGATEPPAKRPAIPLGYTPLEQDKDKPAAPAPDIKQDDDKDISVVRLSAESAPADLPPPGIISRPPLRVNMPVYAMKNAFGPWLKGKILEIQPKNPSAGINFAMCRVKFDHKAKTNGKVLPSRCVAYAEPADVRMTIGTRLIALFKDTNKRESYYSGVVAEIPNPVNNYRYLVFFDDGYAQYVEHCHTRLVCDSSLLVWEEVHPFSREFVRKYLMAYPERPMVRLHEGQHLKTEWDGKWWSSRIEKVDASLAQVMFLGDGRKEWIYRGSTRLAPLYLELRAAEKHRARPMPTRKAQPRSNMPYVEYTRSEEQDSKPDEEQRTLMQREQINEEIRRQRAVAKKSTTPQQPTPPTQHAGADTVTSRVVYYTPKNAVRPYKMVPHDCGPDCKRTDVLTLKELRTYNPLAKPLLSGWERQIVRFKGHKEVMYRAPCGRRVRNLYELHTYLRATDSELPVDLFDFHPATHCLAEFVLNKCLVGKKDLSHGKENVPVPCVNYIDDSLPEFCSYNTERTPTAGVPLNLDPEFLCGCDCTDDCADKSKCACWKMTLEGARTIGLEGPNVGYVYKRLPEPLPSGIYECNSRCKCKSTCLNRVAQHPLQLKLQVFKTLNRGWGIRALNDVPKGCFLCVYAGNLLTDATANLDGLNEGDEYLAELDYIEVVEQMKEGYEEDIPEHDKKLDKKDQGKEDDEEEEESDPTSEEEEKASDKEDDDFRPGHIGLGVTEFSKRLRKRDKKEKKEKAAKEREKQKEKERESKGEGEEDCITISDDEEIREPSRFTAQDNMGANDFVSKYKSVRSLFGKDEACYIMDAKVQGNIGRYLNHSCRPNVFVQNVFVDTHDPRFPWVAFFALSHIKAGTELTWNYNYDVGSVPGKVLYCFCGAANCRGRLL